MQGTGLCQDKPKPAHRFIPAYAGNRVIFPVVVDTITVHPRICREQLLLYICDYRAIGSSPHMQGTAPVIYLRLQSNRFIPAYARNKWYIKQKIKKTRFIPAYAGNRLNNRPQARNTTVHPRVCREQTNPPFCVLEIDGSSPRMQGTVPRSHQNPPKSRFIPAYAGNRMRPSDQKSPQTVHPRVCREQCPSKRRSADWDDSSPRMQGTGDYTRVSVSDSRFIPAYAGNRSRRTGVV